MKATEVKNKIKSETGLTVSVKKGTGSRIGYGPVLKCKCEMPAKMHGKNLCWRCKRSLS